MGNGNTIVGSVLPSSIAEEAGIECGDRIISINDTKIIDIFDYKFLIADENLTLEIEKSNGEIWEVEIEKEEYEDLGMEFENSMLDDAKSCRNKCIFCFIDQLPPGLRETLYFKDDDSRLSFLMGNYVTLTNMNSDDIDRIIRYRMTPINVSVHTTNPELRVSMLNNRFAGDVLEKIEKLVDGGITVNCQIVLCRDINDGEHLDKTISDIAGLYPGVRSVSVVPVGITRYREGLHTLKPYHKESSESVISQVEEWQNSFIRIHGSRIVFLADEFYVMADRKVPDFEHYEDFPQIENGVGMIASFKQEFQECMAGSLCVCPSRRVSVVTGVSAYRYIREMSEALEGRFSELKVDVHEIKNDFFGEYVTVAGLVTGRDIVSQLKGKHLGEELLIPKTMLRSGERVFLDDYTVEMIGKELNVKVTEIDNNGRDFVHGILGIKSSI